MFLLGPGKASEIWVSPPDAIAVGEGGGGDILARPPTRLVGVFIRTKLLARKWWGKRAGAWFPTFDIGGAELKVWVCVSGDVGRMEGREG